MENKDKIILHLCCSEFGSDTLPYKNAGYDVRYVDKNVDVRKYEPPENVYGIFANPPCTMFSKARTKAKIIAVENELITTCGSKSFDNIYTATAVRSKLVINLIINFLKAIK